MASANTMDAQPTPPPPQRPLPTTLPRPSAEFVEPTGAPQRPKPKRGRTGAWADRITRPPSDLARVLHQASRRALTDADFVPPITFSFKHRQRDVFIYAVFILFCNLAIPCVLYYVLRDNSDLSDHALLGVGAASLGISSCFDHPFRMWKLWSHRDYYGPLGDDNRWHFDALNHVYTVGLLVFAVPLAVATSTDPVMEFLMSTPMLLAPVGLLLLFTLFPVSLPMWVSSDPPHTRLKPGMFYIAEDLGAVDFRHGRMFRRAMNKRFEASPVFRQLFWLLTLIWGAAFIIYLPCVLGIALTTTFGFAYGFVLGFFFVYLVFFGLVSWALIDYYRKKERVWLHNIKAEAAAEGLEVASVTPPDTSVDGVDRPRPDGQSVALPLAAAATTPTESATETPATSMQSKPDASIASLPQHPASAVQRI